MCNSQSQKKLDKIEELIEEDCNNGRSLHKKLRSKIAQAGQCQQTFIKEIENIKIETAE